MSQSQKQFDRAVITSLAALWFLGAALAPAASPKLEIYLPREVKVEAETVELGTVAVLRGEADLCKKAERISLGRFALPGQTIRLDRVTILSRLASAGIDTDRVVLSGAELVSVRRDSQGISGEGLAELAGSFLEAQLKDQGLIQARPMQVPSDRLLTSEEKVEVVPSLAESRSNGRRVVTLSLRKDGQEIEQVSIPFQVRFRTRKPVAAHAIAAGSEIGAAAIRLEETDSPEPQEAGALAAVGMVALRDIPAGAEIRSQWFKEKTPPILVERRQKVILKVERGSLLITAMGESMDEGRVGDVIRVKRGIRPDERIVVGTVMPDGSVEPLL